MRMVVQQWAPIAWAQGLNPEKWSTGGQGLKHVNLLYEDWQFQRPYIIIIQYGYC